MLVIIAVMTAGSPQLARPARVDLSAMHEAMGSAAEGAQFPSAASYSHFLKARMAHDAGNHATALDQLRLALATDEASSFLMRSLAREYADGGDLRRAELELQKTLASFPDDASSQLLMGRILAEGKKLKRARTHLERAIRLAPTNPDAYLVLAQALMEQGLTDEALRTVERLGAGPSGDPVGYRRLGVALAERGDGARSEKLLKKAVARDQGDVESWATLAHIYESTFRPKKALEAWARAAQGDPENKDVLLSAGRVALRLGNAAEAEGWFEQLFGLDADPETVVRVAFSEPTLLEHLGEVLLKHGRTADAQSCFQRAAQWLATNPEAAERPTQRADLENKLKRLSPERRAR